MSIQSDVLVAILCILKDCGNFKHNYNQCPFTLTINRQSTCCPIQLLLEYLTLRGDTKGAIFIMCGGIPVAREAFALQLSEAI
jgi:hypothetical protein